MSKRERPACVVLVCGATETGKSQWLFRQIKRDKRVIVWDMKGEYARDLGYRLVTTKAELVEAVKSAKQTKISYCSADPKDFDFFCRVAHAWGNCTVIAEELADVTSPGKAPITWGVILRRGRDRFLKVYGVTQRPAESDKTILGNRTLVHCTQLQRYKDRVYMALEMGCDQSLIDSLKPLQYVESHRNGIIKTGNLTF